jgi:hypothetical protein
MSTTRAPSQSPDAIVTPSTQGGEHHLLGRVLGGAGAAINTLLAEGEVGVGPTGHGSRHRLVNNTSCHTRPWEPSCVEIRNNKTYDEAQESFAHTSAGGRTRSVNIPKPSMQNSKDAAGASPRTVMGSSGQCHSMSDDDPVEVVFYFETSSDEGLQGFQDVAEKVSKGELPGECRNTTGQGGFATWCVPRTQFMPLVAPLLANSPQHSSGNDEEDIRRRFLSASSNGPANGN